MGYYNINFKSSQLITPPSVEPVSVKEFRDYARIDDDVDDVNFIMYIKAAREQAEKFTNHPLITQSWLFTWDYIPEDNYQRYDIRNDDASFYNSQGSRLYFYPSDDAFFIPKKKIQSITSITTYDIDNTPVVFDPSNYFLDSHGQRICLNLGSIWPVNLRRRNSLQVQLVAGYGVKGSDVPNDFRLGILAMAKSLYDCRGVGCDISTCLGLLDSYRDYGRRGT